MDKNKLIKKVKAKINNFYLKKSYDEAYREYIIKRDAFWKIRDEVKKVKSYEK